MFEQRNQARAGVTSPKSQGRNPFGTEADPTEGLLDLSTSYTKPDKQGSIDASPAEAIEEATSIAADTADLAVNGAGKDLLFGAIRQQMKQLENLVSGLEEQDQRSVDSPRHQEQGHQRQGPTVSTEAVDLTAYKFGNREAGPQQELETDQGFSIALSVTEKEQPTDAVHEDLLADEAEKEQREGELELNNTARSETAESNRLLEIIEGLDIPSMSPATRINYASVLNQNSHKNPLKARVVEALLSHNNHPEEPEEEKIGLN